MFGSKFFDSQRNRTNDIILENFGCLLCLTKISSSNSSWKKIFGTITFYCSTKVQENNLRMAIQTLEVMPIVSEICNVIRVEDDDFEE